MVNIMVNAARSLAVWPQAESNTVTQRSDHSSFIPCKTHFCSGEQERPRDFSEQDILKGHFRGT